VNAVRLSAAALLVAAVAACGSPDEAPTSAAPRLPAPVQRFFAAVNDGDVAGAVAPFGRTAVVTDLGAEFDGRGEIRSWVRGLVSIDGRYTVAGVARRGERVVVRERFDSTSFDDRQRAVFTVRGSRIVRLVITSEGDS
jgi:hypothetical protein